MELTVKLLKLVLLTCTATAITGCEMAYGTLQSDKKNSCYELPQPEYERCMAEASQSYEDYKKSTQQK